MRRALLILILAAATASAYSPPAGIPNPSTRWGADVLNLTTPAWPASWTAGTPSATANFYYVDKTAAGSTNTSNPYGYPGKARVTPPEGVLAAGAFIYINAGTYTPGDSSGDRFDWAGPGTVDNPIWITGNPTVHPIFTDKMQIGYTTNTSFVILENIDSTGGKASIGVSPSADGININHVLVRNCVMRGTGSADDSTAIGIGISVTSDPYPTSTTNDVIVYNCDLDGFGSGAITGGSDDGGIYNGFVTDHVWALHNIIKNVGSDCISGSHYSNYTNKQTTNYFIGDNTLGPSGENCVDLKAVQTAVVSHNTMTGPAVRGSGALVVFHYGASPSYECKNVQLIFNDMHHSGGGVGNGGSYGNDSALILGNVIHDIHNSLSTQPDPLFGNCVQIGGSSGAIRIIDNTFYDYDEGMEIEDISSGSTVAIHGNIFGSTHTDGARYEIKTVNGEEGRFTLDYNLYPTGATFLWGGSSRNLSYMQGTASQESHGLAGDPLFVSSSNFYLQSGSPAKNVSTEDDSYAAFDTLIGENIEQDILGTSRPQEGAWDMGAYEYNPGGTPTPTPTPSITPTPTPTPTPPPAHVLALPVKVSP